MADAQFRPGLHQMQMSTSFSWTDIAKAQKDDKKLIDRRSSLSSSLVLKDLLMPVQMVSFLVKCQMFYMTFDVYTITLHISP